MQWSENVDPATRLTTSTNVTSIECDLPNERGLNQTNYPHDALAFAQRM